MKHYVNTKGATQWMPSLDEVMEMADNGEGWCLACGSTQYGVEPDARGYTCTRCFKTKVFGAEELALMGLVH
jgi:hypothetical protein